MINVSVSIQAKIINENIESKFITNPALFSKTCTFFIYQPFNGSILWCHSSLMKQEEENKHRSSDVIIEDMGTHKAY